MNSRLENIRADLTKRHALGRLVGALICAAVIGSGVGTTAPGNAGAASRVNDHDANAASSGPTVALSYDSDSVIRNPIDSFLYFIPLVSRSPVDRLTSANNTQEIGIVSFKKTVRGRSFQVSCEFVMQGHGYHQATYRPTEMIALRSEAVDADQPLKAVLNYIKFEGAGIGRMDIRGTVRGSMETVTAIDMHFDEDGRQSPVTVGLYDLMPRDGEYAFENRTKDTVVRVKMLAFERNKNSPIMDVGVESIMNGSASEGFFARIKGSIANLFLKPPKISTLGNETMLEFGTAILNRQTEFTFPAANNIIEDDTSGEKTPDP